MRGLMDEMPMHGMAPEPEEPAPSNDLTLGMTALLGIFFAVVLVCAVFFGFGYSTGRTLHHAKPADAAAAPTGAPPSATAAMQAEDVPSAAVPAPALAAAPTPAIQKPMPGAALEDASPASEDAESTPARTRPLASRRAATLAVAPRPVAAAPVAASPAAGQAGGIAGGIMVQIAAVVHPGDADALANALRKNGYSAVVRTEPQDSFLHVQIGPFATRDQAKAMRARLQGDGYNAFIK